MRQIVVFGNSFAALHAVRELQNAIEGRTRLELSLVAPRNGFVYSPLLPHVVGGSLEADALTFPLEDALAPSTGFERTTVRTVDVEERELVGEDRRIPFDYLVFAPGSVPNWGGLESTGERRAAWTLEGASELETYLRERLRRHRSDDLPPDRHERPVAVIGGGPAGIEIASELRHVVRQWRSSRNDDAEADAPPRDVPICVVERRNSLLPDAPDPLRRACRAHFRSANIQWRTDTRAVACEDSSLEFDGDSSLEVDAVVHCTGLRPPDLVERSPFPVDDLGRIEVEPNLGVPECPGIYVAGVAAGPPDSPPLRAHLAADQGVRAAKNLHADLSGRTLRDWTPDDDSWLLTLGSSGAAVFKGESLMTGRSARVLYRLRHASWMPAPLADSGRALDWLQAGPDATP